MRHISTLALTAALTFPMAANAVTPAEVLTTYSDIAEAAYTDSLNSAQNLSEAIAAFLAAPSEAGLENARAAWIAARVPYQQTEAYRFGNPIVDDWEGRVNAWPLDEGLIDYVARSYIGGDDNPAAQLNVIANPSLTLSGETIDASVIDATLLQDVLQEADAVEANVATGYHAIEFLLWGQDLHGTDAGAGERPWTDYAQGDACTNGNCDRRAAYLRAATGLLITDLEEMAANWTDGGAAREAVTADETAGLSAILTGMGSLSYGELAGERIRLGLMLNDPEEEHDCFSDNTHYSHYYDGLGIRNVYTGSYTRTDGSVVDGPSLSDLVAQTDPALDQALTAGLDASVAALQTMVDTAEGGMSYDMMLAPGNETGETVIMGAVDALVAQTRDIERVIVALNLDGVAIEGSDSLDNPGAVFE
ncbi:imelysin family protein [Pararhodobacter zhoushanensis]|uniref:Peptidase n=1 Tax=Pararhodobacter zhoushanensis TaxID=2479545 RepID=A0ABT3GZ68_9RHOB|nr:imelysin family protein [Pararhodobacter zhoushanensis]MCW1932859.1 peptidase [Pararhodobacter zhoushanensis]